MIVITADQVDSRSTPDLAAETIARINAEFGAGLLLAADRTAGDEIQMLTTDGRTALEIVLALTRTGRWSVGLGLGLVRHPLGDSARESSGDAFIAARGAVERAKKRATRFAIATQPSGQGARDLEAIADLLLILRARRSDQGWEMHDLVDRGLTQAEAAAEIGITPQSASKRARAADLKAEDAARAPLARLLDSLDARFRPEQTP